MTREMKNSGIEWIGQIPSDWETDRLQWHLEEIKVQNSPVQSEQVLSLTIEAGVIPYEDKGNQGNKAKENYEEYKLAYPDTLVVNSMNIIIGAVGISKYFGCVSPVYYVFKATEDTDLRYIYYIFTNVGFQKELRKYAKGILEIRLRISASDMLKRIIPKPSYEEQKRIADFLDRKCAEIDTVIAKTQATIEEYKKLKQSVITEAVTKGIRGERPMKDSGIEWIGEIPADWDINSAFQLFVQVKNKNAGLVEKNLLSLSYGKIKRKSIDTIGGLLPESFDGYNIIEKDDIVLRLTDLQNDHTSLRVGLSTEKGIVTSAYTTLRNRSANLPIYLYYYLHSFDIAKGFYGMGAGVRQGLNWDGLKKLKIVIPTVKEQQEIVDYLEIKCAEIDKLIANKTQLLSELENYKKSVIYEYVTGKKDV